MSAYVKNNGFSRKPHAYQIFSYLWLLAKVIAYTVVVLPLNELIPAVNITFLGLIGSNRCFLMTNKVILSVFYYLAVMVMFYFGYKCTVSDPTDEVIRRTREAEAKGENFDTSRYDFYCATCRSSVQDNSKHCWPCNRCVNDFDHHCKWVNNCISKKNYKEFLALISSVAVSMLIFCIAALLAIIRYGTNSDSLIASTLWYKNLSSQQLEGLFLITCVFFGLNLVFMTMDVRLMYFHVWLIRHKISTYEYIKMIREKLEQTNRGKPGKTKSKKGKIHAIMVEKNDDQSKDAHADEFASSPMAQKEKLWNEVKHPNKVSDMNEIPTTSIKQAHPNFKMEIKRIEIPQSKLSTPGPETHSATIIGDNPILDNRRDTGIINKNDFPGSPTNHHDSLLGKSSARDLSSADESVIKQVPNNYKTKGIRLSPIESRMESHTIEVSGQVMQLRSSSRLTEPNE